MPRQPRGMRAHLFYHIIIRGNNRIWLFDSTANKQLLLDLIKRFCQKHTVLLYHYCLMDNHAHFVMKSVGNDNAISKVLQATQMVFAKHYKKQTKMTGAIFEGRYKSFLIQSDAYVLECGRYIERNPIRAGMVISAEEYPWSSFSFYAHGNTNELLSPNPAYLSLGETSKERQDAYRRYVSNERVYETIVDEYFKQIALV